jgi:hypothetical protein
MQRAQPRDGAVRWAGRTALTILLVAAPEVARGGELTPESEVAATGPPAILAVNPFAFEGLDASDGDALRAVGVRRGCLRDDGLDCLLEAPIVLPTGTEVTGLELDAVDLGPRNVKLNLYRCPVGEAGCAVIDSVETAGEPGAVQVEKSLANVEIIDNSSFTYLLEVFPGNDTDTAFTGARLEILSSEDPPETDELALPGHAFEAEASIMRNALAVGTPEQPGGIQRSCSGTDCELLAPLLLPTGATVGATMSPPASSAATAPAACASSWRRPPAAAAPAGS